MEDSRMTAAGTWGLPSSGKFFSWRDEGGLAGRSWNNLNAINNINYTYMFTKTFVCYEILLKNCCFILLNVLLV